VSLDRLRYICIMGRAHLWVTGGSFDPIWR